MKRRNFIKSSFLLSTATLFPRVILSRSKNRIKKIKNWAGNLTYSSKQYLEPDSIEKIQYLV
ncbi:MAG: FAD-binding protein, partial [Candidatus Neomarinimicrobiota bacterium]